MATLSNECIYNILTFLEFSYLYNCLFINRNWCVISIPILWRDPFYSSENKKHKLKNTLLNTLLSLLNEEEISLMNISRPNNQVPLCGYGKFIKKIDQGVINNSVSYWLSYDLYHPYKNNFKIQNLVNVIIHMIMRQGSNLQELCINVGEFDLPDISTFIKYKPGITNLKSLSIYIGRSVKENETKYQNFKKFLEIVPKYCNNIVNCSVVLNNSFTRSLVCMDLKDSFMKSLFNIIQSQPLEFIHIEEIYEQGREILHAILF